MQKNNQKRIIPPHQVAHRLDRLAKPYLVWLYIFAVLPAFVMFALMFVDSEGIKFETMSFSVENFKILTEESTIIAFFNSLKYSVVTTIICIFFGYFLTFC